MSLNKTAPYDRLWEHSTNRMLQVHDIVEHQFIRMGQHCLPDKRFSLDPSFISVIRGPVS